MPYFVDESIFNKVHRKDFTGDMFIYCPWCGIKLETFEFKEV